MGEKSVDFVLESKRLGFCKLCKDDFIDLCNILQDIEIMYAWEHAFADEEVWEWIDKNLIRYSNEGYSYYALIEKNTNQFVGVMGPLVEQINGISYIGIGYILNKLFWKKGFALEGAKACMEYAFYELKAEIVIADIRPENDLSCKVAEKLGMKIIGGHIKQYNGKKLLHYIYAKEKI